VTKPNQSSVVPDKSENLAAALNQETESMDKTGKTESKGKKSQGTAANNLSIDIVNKLKKAVFLDSKGKDSKNKKRTGKNKKRGSNDDASEGDDDGAKSVDFDDNFSGDEGVGSGDENKINNSEPFADEDDDGDDSEPIFSEDEQENPN
jgi:hypothetical protein